MKMKPKIIAICLCVVINNGAYAVGGPGFILSARYYDTTSGRFIAPDTIVQAPNDPQSLNRYAYVRNNPLNLIDPSGQSWLSHATGIHINANRFIHHNLGIDRVSFGAYAGPGGEMSFYFSDKDVKVGGGVGAGLGMHLGTSFSDFDVQTTQGAYVSAGYDPYGGSYISAGGGVGPVNGSGIYYPETNNYQIGGGLTAGRAGVGASYSSFGGTHISAGGAGVGASYGLKDGRARYSVNPAAFGGLRPNEAKEVDYSKFDTNATYGGPGGVGDYLVPDLWWNKAFYGHDSRFSSGDGSGDFYNANQAMAVDMTKASLDFIRAHPFLSPFIIPVTALLVPLYFSAVTVPGAVYYPFANGR